MLTLMKGVLSNQGWNTGLKFTSGYLNGSSAHEDFKNKKFVTIQVMCHSYILSTSHFSTFSYLHSD